MSVLNCSDTCCDVQSYKFESVDLLAIQCIFTILYCLVWIAAIVGNTLVLYVVTFNQVSLSVRSVFIGCLAISDLLMSLTSLPVTAITIFTREWIFPSIVCKLIGVLQGGSIFVSSFTLTVIAIDRCLLILKPNIEVINYNGAMISVGIIWIVGYSLAMPVGIYSKAISYDTICGVFCEETWPDFSEVTGRSDHRQLYGVAVLLLQFATPALISSFCYWKISQVMSMQLNRRRGHKLLPESEEKLVSRKTRANRMMIVMCVGFIFAWSPLNAINLYRDLSTFTNTSSWYSTVFALCHLCAMLSGVLNPVIYSWFNPQFRSAIQSIWKKEEKKTPINPTKYHTEVVPFRSEIKTELLAGECLPGDQLL